MACYITPKFWASFPRSYRLKQSKRMCPHLRTIPAWKNARPPEGIVARMIFGTKQSEVKNAIATGQRVILPGLVEAARRLFNLLSKCTDRDSIDSLVLDFIEVFWQTPTLLEEQRFFAATAMLRGIRKYLVFLFTIEGSRGAPFALAALVMRLRQSLFDPSEVNLVCYVDDPLALLKGTQSGMDI